MSQVESPTEVVAEDQEEELVKLFLRDGGSQEAVILVRWCVQRKLLTRFQQELFPNPHILICVCREAGMMYDGKTTHWEETDTERHLFPIHQLMGHLQFKRPGRHQIHATLVWGKDIFSLYNTYLSSCNFNPFAYGGQFDKTRLRPPAKIEIGETTVGPPVGHTQVEVTVAKEFFAKEPPRWLARWAGVFWKHGPVDQCDFRKRVLLLIVTLPFQIALFVVCLGFWILVAYPFCSVLRLPLLLWALLLGIRDINWRSFLWLTTEPFTEAVWGKIICSNHWTWPKSQGSLQRSVFFYCRDGKPRLPFFWFCAPVFPLLIMAGWILYSVLSGTGGNINWLLAAGGSVVISLATGLALTALLPLLKRLDGWLFDRQMTKWFQTPAIQEAYLQQRELREQEKKLKEEREKKQKQERRAELYMPLVCTGTTPPVAKNAVPKQNRTFDLWFQDLKAKVCRPYARQ